MELRTCTICHSEKPLDDFPRINATHRRRHCKPCHAKNTKRWKNANPEAMQRNRRAYRARQRYGLTPEEYDALLEAAIGSPCPICGNEITSEHGVHRYALDHNHTSGKVRAVICHGCNVGLGMFKENPAALMAAVSYLEAHQEP